MTSVRKEIREGEKIPTGYGIAYRDYPRCVGVCYPIPVNFIAGWLRSLYFFMAHGPKSKLAQLLSEQYRLGREDFRNGDELKCARDEAFRAGYRRALNDLEERIEKHD